MPAEERFLNCHPRTPAPAIQRLSASLQIRPEGGLRLRYQLAGDIARLRIAATKAHPERGDRLWELTCFEVFLARADQAAYREFNFSPSGDWAMYAFADYRRPGEPQESERLAPPRLSILQTAGRVELTAELDASALPPGNAALLVGLTAVVESDDLGDGRHSYWALHHPSERPDFHHRAGFTWVLPTD